MCFKNCCPNCFESVFLEDFIVEHSQEIGKCDYCNSDNVPLIPVQEMGIHLRDCLSKAYDSVDNGTGAWWDPEEKEYIGPSGGLAHVVSIREIMEEERLLSDESEGTGLLEELFENLYSVREIQKGAVDPYDDVDACNWVIRNGLYGQEINSVNRSWEVFKHSALHFLRFMGANLYASGDSFFSKFRNIIMDFTHVIPKGSLFYRVRIIDKELEDSGVGDVYNTIGPPPAERSKTNRMSPAGIPYLYLASDIKTAIEECRAAQENTLMAEYRSTKALKIVDLSESFYYPLTSIFDPGYVHEDRWIGKVWEGFIHDISQPVDESDPDHSYEYTPTQMIAEYVRLIDYDGICYKSSMSCGKNYVFFFGPDPDHTPNAYPYPFGDVYLEDYIKILPKFTDYFEITETRSCRGED